MNKTDDKSINFFKKMCKVFYYCGLPNFWVDEITTSTVFVYYHKLLTVIMIIFIISEWLSFLTQDHLSEKQESDRIVFLYAHPILFSCYWSTVFYKNMIKSIVHKLAITMKQEYCDPEVERYLFKRSIFYAAWYIFTVSFALISYGFDGLMQVARSGKLKNIIHFITVSITI